MSKGLRSVYFFARDVFKEYVEDRGGLFAAAIGFFGLISLIPLMLLAIGIFGYVLGSGEALDTVVGFMQNYIPIGTEDLAKNLASLSQQSGLLSGIGFVGLVWTGMQVFVILQQVMIIALGSRKHLGFFKARAVALLMVIVAGALLALSIGITSFITVIRSYNVHIWGVGPGDMKAFWDFIGVLGPALTSTLAFVLIYRFLPMVKIGMICPLAGGIFAGLLFELAKSLFKWYVVHFAHFARVYGSLGSVVVLVIWIYYVSMILVLGAEVASVCARRKGLIAPHGR